MQHARRRAARLLLCVIGDNNCNNDGDDGKNDKGKQEADPPLFSCATSRDNGLIRVDNSGADIRYGKELTDVHSVPCFHVFLYIYRGRFYAVYHVTLLLYHDAHLHKETRVSDMPVDNLVRRTSLNSCASSAIVCSMRWMS